MAASKTVGRTEPTNGDRPGVERFVVDGLFQCSFKWIAHNTHRKRRVAIGESLVWPLDELGELKQECSFDLALYRGRLAYERRGLQPRYEYGDDGSG